MKKLLAALAMTLLMTGCAELEFGSTIYKKATYEDTQTASTANNRPLQQGTFKVGKPYAIDGTVYHPKETYNYVETGIASWYGPGFHGKKTASGEIYHQGEMTAAHRTLQMPSIVRVTNLGNGRSVIVRVNDRGPFAKGRIIDVSESAAKLLNMTGPGTARVKVELLAEESRQLAEAARGGANLKGTEIAYNNPRISAYAPPSMAPITDASGRPQLVMPEEVGLATVAQQDNVQGHYTNGRFYPDQTVTQMPVTPTGIYIQVGAFGVEENAQKLSTKLSSISPAKVEPVFSGSRTLYKVKLGPLQSVREADSVLTRVLTSGHSDAIIVVN